MSAKEHKTLVTSEDEIKIGDLLEFDCGLCSKAHRFMVLEEVPPYPATITLRGHVVKSAATRAFVIQPELHPEVVPSHITRIRGTQLVSGIVARRLYRIDTGLLDEVNPYTAVKAPKKVRT